MRNLLVFVCLCSVGVLGAPSQPETTTSRIAYYKDLLPASSRIVGGQIASRRQFPYQVSLQWGILGLFAHICGGTVIAQAWVVTAAHCIMSFGSNRVVAGIVDQGQNDEDTQIRGLSAIIEHPLWPGGLVVVPNDIALLLLDSPLAWTEAVQPASLPAANQQFSGVGTLSGWGYLAFWLPITPTTLRFAHKAILTNQECADALISVLGEVGPLDDTMVCSSGADSVTACSGDSGGPFVQNGVLVGVVSWGIDPCGTPNAPSVYTRVTSFLDWIRVYVPA